MKLKLSRTDILLFFLGNSWGKDDYGEGLGYGQQEEFYACADVAIGAGNGDFQASDNPQPSKEPKEKQTSTQFPEVEGANGIKTTESFVDTFNSDFQLFYVIVHPFNLWCPNNELTKNPYSPIKYHL